jgi:hypothetical protein
VSNAADSSNEKTPEKWFLGLPTLESTNLYFISWIQKLMKGYFHIKYLKNSKIILIVYTWMIFIYKAYLKQNQKHFQIYML